MASSPLLSICIPTYNRVKRFSFLLRSLVAQIEANDLGSQVEIVLSDNDSSDRTSEIGEACAAKHPFVRYFRNEWNIGGDANQVRAVERGIGKYSWILGDDDQVHEKAIPKILSYLKPGVVKLFLNYRCMNVEGDTMIDSQLDSEIPDRLITIELIKRLGFVSSYALISSHVFDREMFLAADPKSLIKISPWYIMVVTHVAAFAHLPTEVVREVLLDYTTGNDRYTDEVVGYLRVMGVLKAFVHLEAIGKINGDFLFSCYERGGGIRHYRYLREELYNNLVEMTSYWALPGRADWAVIRRFIERGPGFWGVRNQLRGYFNTDFHNFRNHQKPMIHYWQGKATPPGFSLLLSSDKARECEDFDVLMGQWPEKFAHESILITRLPEDQTSYMNIDVLMAPFRRHRSPSASLNSGFRKALAPRVLVVDEVSSPAMTQVIDRIDQWHVGDDAPPSCLLFATLGENGMPEGLLGLYLQRRQMIDLGGFENNFDHWTRRHLLADAAYRLKSEAWAMEGGKVAPAALRAWLTWELPPWLRVLRTFRKAPCSEHGLNINLRHHLKRLDAEGYGL